MATVGVKWLNSELYSGAYKSTVSVARDVRGSRCCLKWTVSQ